MDLWDYAETTITVVRPPAMIGNLLGGPADFPAFSSLPPAGLPNAPLRGSTALPSEFPQIWVPGRAGQAAPPRPESPWKGAPAFLDVIGQPSLKVYFENGATVVELTRLSQFTPNMRLTDMVGMQRWSDDVFNLLVNMSRGPYTKKDLAQAGNPYGFDLVLQDGKATKQRRRVPRYINSKSIGHVKGVRGSVPTMTVINSPSGNFARHWTHEIRVRPDGISMVWRNDATSDKGFPYSWALAAGTEKMQAHGPWTYAVLQYINQIDVEWRRQAWAAAQRGALDDAMAGVLAMSSNFH